MALRLLTAGESHGPGLVAVLEGIPHGLPLTAADIDRDLARRQLGYGRGGRMKIEKDRVRIVGGVRHGRTLGSPIALWIPNRDWENWSRAMAPEPLDPAAQAAAADDWRLEPITRPRPGHADLAGALKYGSRDIRDILERASARETAARVAAGAVARKLLSLFGVRIQSYVVRIGEVAIPSPVLEYGEDGRPPVDPVALEQATEASPVRCPDPVASERMVEAIRAAGQAGDTLGGVFEILVTGVPAGLGSHVSGDRRLEGRLAGALMALNAIKGVEVGLGFAAAALPGSRVHDPIGYRPPATAGAAAWVGAPEGAGSARATAEVGTGEAAGAPEVARAAGVPGATSGAGKATGAGAAGAPGTTGGAAVAGLVAMGGGAGTPLPGVLAAAARAGADGWRGPAAGFFRFRNGAGGIEGGITNGEPLVLRAAMKPIATLRRPLPSADLLTGEPFTAHHERSDICAVPAAAVVGEAIVALELASAWLEKFGGDSVDEVLRNYAAYCERLAAWVAGPGATGKEAGTAPAGPAVFRTRPGENGPGAPGRESR